MHLWGFGALRCCCTSIGVAIMGAVKLTEALCLVPRASAWESLHRSPADGQFCARSTAPGRTPPSCQPRFSSCWWSEGNRVVVYTRSCAGQPCAPRKEVQVGQQMLRFPLTFSTIVLASSSTSSPLCSRRYRASFWFSCWTHTHTHTSYDSNIVRHILKTHSMI